MGDLIFTIPQGLVDIFTFESSHFSFLYIVASVGRQNSVGIGQPVVGLIVKAALFAVVSARLFSVINLCFPFDVFYTELHLPLQVLILCAGGRVFPGDAGEGSFLLLRVPILSRLLMGVQDEGILGAYNY